MKEIKIALSGVAIVAWLLSGTGCTTDPSKVATSRLSELMRANKYSLYTPARTDDQPGTIFVFTKNHEGWATEFTLSPWQTTFYANPGDLFPVAGTNVSFAKSLSETNSVDLALAVKVLQPVIDLSVAGKYVKTINVTFGDDQRKFVMGMNTLSSLRDKFQEKTINALNFWKQRGQLHQCYIVMETLQVNSMDINIEIKPEFDAKIAIDKIKAVVSPSASLTNHSDRAISIVSKTPLLLGYKALPIDEALISSVVSKPPLSGTLLTPDEIETIKR